MVPALLYIVSREADRAMAGGRSCPPILQRSALRAPSGGLFLLRGGSAHLLSSILGAAPAFRRVGADQIALHVREAAQDGNPQSARCWFRCRPALGATHLSKTRPEWS